MKAPGSKHGAIWHKVFWTPAPSAAHQSSPVVPWPLRFAPWDLSRATGAWHRQGILQSLAHPSLTMGTLADGTLCAYCGRNEANYIPDGCAGPVCFWPDGASCWDASQLFGWNTVIQRRLTRFARYTFLRLAANLHRVWSEQCTRVCICQFLIHH